MKPNFFCSSFSGADAPKVCMPIIAPRQADVALPAERRRLLDRRPAPCTLGGSTLRRGTPAAWSLEQLPRRHAHDARLDALGRRAARRRRRTSDDLAAGRHAGCTSGLPSGGVGQHVGALAPRPAAGAYFVRSSVGSAWRVRTSADRLVLQLHDHPPRLGDLVGVARAERRSGPGSRAARRAARSAGASGRPRRRRSSRA